MNDKYLEAGKIVSTHGVRGEVKVLPWADAPEFLLRFKTFYLAQTPKNLPCQGEVPKCAHWGGGVGDQDSASFERARSSDLTPPPSLRPVPLPLAGEVCPPPTSLSVEASRVQKTCVLIKFRGVDTVEQAQKLRDRVISIARDDPRIPAGTVFQADLIGMPVFADGTEIGKIAEILSMPSSDVWVVKGEKEYMIPNVRAFVPEIDLALGRIDVNLIEGMQTDAD